jgi:hypothetical protein
MKLKRKEHVLSGVLCVQVVYYGGTQYNRI